MFPRTTLITGCITLAHALIGLGGLGSEASGQQAYWSLEGDFQNATDSLELFLDLEQSVSSSATFGGRTFGHDGGTNAAGDSIPAGGFDPILELFEVTGGTSLGRNDDGDGLNRDSLLTWKTGPSDTDAINTDPLPAGGYRMDLTAFQNAFPGGRSPYAVDLFGPWVPVELTGLNTTGGATIRSLKLGSEPGGSAFLDVKIPSITIEDSLVLGQTGEAQLLLNANATINANGTTAIGSGGRLEILGENSIYNSSGTMSVAAGSLIVLTHPNAVLKTAVLDVDPLSTSVFGWNSGTLEITGESVDIDSIASHSLFTNSQVIDVGQKLVLSNSDPGIGRLQVGATGQGDLLIRAGGKVATVRTYVGANSGADGAVTVDGTGSELAVSTDLRIGGNSTSSGGTGRLRVQNDAQVTADVLQNWADGTVVLAGGEINVGSFANTSGGIFTHSGGKLTVTGGGFAPVSSGISYAIDAPGTTPTVVLQGGAATSIAPFNLFVGELGRGRLEIRGGSKMAIAGSAFLAFYTTDTAHGELLVDGIGSTLTVPQALEVGDGRRGILTISNGGLVDSFSTASSFADVIGDDATAHGTVVVTGAGSRLLSNHLVVANNAGGTGELQVDTGGRVEVATTLSVGSNGTVTAGDGLVVVGTGAPVFLDGIQVTSGGRVEGTGTLFGLFDNTGGTVAPGHSPGILTADNYNQTAAGTLEIELGGLTPGSEHDQLFVNFDVFLDGALDVLLIDAVGGLYNPGLNDSFEIIRSENGIVDGTFDLGVSSLPMLDPGLFWDLDYQSQSVFLNVVDTPPGNADFDGDNDVDGADFLSWQRGFPGTYSQQDLANWQRDYGNGPLSASEAVPEPGAGLLLLAGTLGSLSPWRKKR